MNTPTSVNSKKSSSDSRSLSNFFSPRKKRVKNSSSKDDYCQPQQHPENTKNSPSTTESAMVQSQLKYKTGSNNSNSSSSSSRFQSCPICLKTYPIHVVANHASNCIGLPATGQVEEEDTKGSKRSKDDSCQQAALFSSARNLKDCNSGSTRNTQPQEWNDIFQKSTKITCNNSTMSLSKSSPLPGLYLFEEFITEQEEEAIVHMIDGKDTTDGAHLPWKPSRFNGKHSGKRWGVHCNLKDRKVYPEENPLPSCLIQLIDGRIRQLDVMKGCVPNEANAIEYQKIRGDYLKHHVDDRQLSKEAIANLSLVGDCYMTFRLEKSKSSPHLPKEQKVLLKRRTLQVLTASARYDYSHGIQNEDLLCERRISVTMRESPVSIIF